MANQIYNMFPGLSYDLILQSINQTGSLQATLTLIMDDPEPFYAPDEPITTNEMEIQNSRDMPSYDQNAIYISAEEYEQLMAANPDDYKGAFKADENGDATLEQQVCLMVKYSRMQYLLKNLSKVQKSSSR